MCYHLLRDRIDPYLQREQFVQILADALASVGNLILHLVHVLYALETLCQDGQVMCELAEGLQPRPL